MTKTVPQGQPRACKQGCGRVAIPGPITKHERRCLTPFTRERLLEAYGHFVRGADECWPGSDKGSGNWLPGHKAARLYVISAVLFHDHTPEPPAPGAKMVCHTCDNRDCWNPAHLYIGTAADNSKDTLERSKSMRAWRESRKVELTCMVCGNKFTVSKTIAQNKSKYPACSAECKVKRAKLPIMTAWLSATPEQKAEWVRKGNEGRRKTREAKNQ